MPTASPPRWRFPKIRGEYVSPSDARVTVGELGPAWLERKRGHLKPSGFTTIETAWRTRVKAVQKMLGHASAAMTLDTYADLFDSDLEAVAVALDRARLTECGQSVGRKA